MSKIANRILLIPNDVKVYHEFGKLIVSGPNGSLSQDIPQQVNLVIENNNITTKFFSNEEKNEAILGTINSLISNMLEGVTNGYKKVLEIKGVGYKVILSEKKLDFSLGHSHNIVLEIPSTLKVECLNNVKLIIKGPNKQEVGWFAAKIRNFRKPNVFVKNLKGIFYEGEKIKIKAGKKEAKK